MTFTDQLETVADDIRAVEKLDEKRILIELCKIVYDSKFESENKSE